MKRECIASFVGLLTLLTVTGYSANQERPANTVHPPFTNEIRTNAPAAQSVEPNYPIVIYDNKDYIQEGQTLHHVQSYFSGEVYTDDIKPISKEQATLHSPWHTDPVQVAQICTANLQPPMDQNQSGKGQVIPNQTTSIEAKGQLITFQVTKHTPATHSTPETAEVESTGLAHNLRVYLFVPKGTYTWIIYRIEMLG